MNSMISSHRLAEVHGEDAVTNALRKAMQDLLAHNIQGNTRWENPYAPGGFLPAYDPLGPRIELAACAILARDWFATNGPQEPDLQPLPIGYHEREALKAGGAPHILAWYARSLECLDYDIGTHPDFYTYACGVMASPHAPGFITGDARLQKRFPPKPLLGLGRDLFWKPPSSPVLSRPMARGTLR
ncbi:hypothetical protein [Bradyrhizobium guangzhouense]|uniref:hypothetical protein n=1 Tax=Bradyrhizobium guangzhouense TaxID=1325095 RepID=UPI0010098D08|nr:hypothetical protein [Bradyrhizobium guangzhouense]RXH12464.1 hypothetical protein EAS54_26310 [Bradyrhizobium guangzhouense]